MKKYLSVIAVLLLFLSGLPTISVPAPLPPPWVKVFVDQPLGYIPFVFAGAHFRFDIMIVTSGFNDVSTPSIVGWTLDFQVDPDVISLNTTVGGGFPPTPPDAKLIGNKAFYVMYDFGVIVPPYPEPMLTYLPPPPEGGYWDDIVEVYVPLPATGWGDYMTNTYYGGPATLVTFEVTSKSDFQGCLIDLLNVAWLDADNVWHPVDIVDDGYYGTPPPDLSIEGILLPYMFTYQPLMYPNPPLEFGYEINATVTNLGTGDADTFTVCFYAYLGGWGSLSTMTVFGLGAGETENVSFYFFPEDYGNYTLVIEADFYSQILETDETNNLKTTWVIGTIRGDVNGDGRVDAYDFGDFAFAYGRIFEQPPYDPADFDYDGDVDAYDFGTFAANYGKTV
jgi:hypothetical protein